MPSALANSVESSTPQRESPSWNNESESQHAIANERTLHQKRLEPEPAPNGKQIPRVVDSQITQSSPQNWTEKAERVSSITGGIVVTFVFIGYVLDELFYRKHRVSRATILLQQIETLEKIWKMPPQHRSK
ncbi:MAG TPA: hypothetical protein V6C85_07705 [Allocoleopsis sp.]